MLDEAQERDRSLAARQQQEQRTLAVSQPTFISCTLPGCQPAASVAAVAMQEGSRTFVLCQRGSSVAVSQARWTRAEAEAETEAAVAMQESESTYAWSLQLSPQPHAEVLGSVQQMCVLPASAAHARSRDLLLLTSDSGFLSLLTLDGGRLRAIAHTRIGAPGLGRTQLGAILRVSSEGPAAIAVASREAHPSAHSAGAGTEATSGLHARAMWSDGGILVYSIVEAHGMAVDEGQVERPAAAAAAVAASASHPVSLPELRSPLSVPFDGVLTALLFLPPPANHPSVVRMLLAVVPRSTDAGPPLATRSVRSQLILVQLDLRSGGVASTPYPLQLSNNDIVLDMLIVNPRGASPAQAASPASHSSTRAAPCFVLLQLESRVLLLDIDSASTLHFPVSLSLPPWADAADQLLQRSVGAVPLITAWAWLRDRRLACVTETGEVHLLHLWWNEPHSDMPPADAPVQRWMRWVPLGLATPSACMLALASPPDAHSQSHASDCLFLPGEAAEGIQVRVDWQLVEKNVQTSLLHLSSSSQSATAASLPLVPASLESPLVDAQHLPNLSPTLDFVSFNATIGTAAPSKHGQLFVCSGSGRHGALRVVRPNSVEGQLDVDSGEGSASGALKVFRALIPLRALQPHSQQMETVALVYSFVGSSRVRALLRGELDDVSDAMAAGGFNLARQTLDAALIGRGDVLLQVHDRAVRAIAIRHTPQEEFAGRSLLATWNPDAAADSHAEAALFTLAHIHGDSVLLSMAGSRTVVLLQFHQGSAASPPGFSVVGRAHLPSDISAVYLAAVPSAANSTSRLLCMVATHDCGLHIFQSASQPSAAPTNASTAAAPADLQLCHQLCLKSLLPNTRDSDLSYVAESLLLYQPSSNPHAQPQLLIGLRNGHLICCGLHPYTSSHAASSVASGAAASSWLRHCVVRKLGSAPVKLAQLGGIAPDDSSTLSLLALCDQTFVVRLPASDATRQSGLSVRELVWPWGTAMSAALQHAASFSSSAMPHAVACVIGQQFYLADIDPSCTQPSISKAFELGGTPRRIIRLQEEGCPPLLCVLTVDHTASGSVSRLLLVSPRSGLILHEHRFGASGSGQAVIAYTLHMWRCQRDTFVVVGTVSTSGGPHQGSQATLYLFKLDRASSSAAAATASSSSSAAPMDVSDEASAPASTPTASVVPLPSASSSYCLRVALAWSTPSSGPSARSVSRVWSVCPLQKNFLLMATDSQLWLLMHKDGKLGAAQVVAIHSPAVDMSPLPWNGGHRVLITDREQGLSLWAIRYRSKAEGGIAIERTHTDPYARIARQAIAFTSTARMQPAHTLPAYQTGHPLVLRDPAAVAAAASSPTSLRASILRMVGFDVFGRVFVLRQNPDSEAAILGATTTKVDTKVEGAATGATAPVGVTRSPAAASASTASSRTPLIVDTSLVQEGSFNLGSTPSRVHMLPTASSAASSSPTFVLSTLTGALHGVREVDAADGAWLRALQHELSLCPLSRSLVANHHASYRSFFGADMASAPVPPPSSGIDRATETMIDGDMLASFLALSHEQQQAMCSKLPKDAQGEERQAWQVREALLQHVQIHI